MNYRIWSVRKGAWWKPDGNGYTQVESEAGIYNEFHAIEICLHSKNEDGTNKPGSTMVPVREN